MPKLKNPQEIEYQITLYNKSNLNILNASLQLKISDKSSQEPHHSEYFTVIYSSEEQLPFLGILPWIENNDNPSSKFISIPEQSYKTQKLLIYNAQKKLLTMKSHTLYNQFKNNTTQHIYLISTQDFFFTIYLTADNITNKTFSYHWNPMHQSLSLI
ncbi:MAG: hypothetical protein Q8K70_07900 [Bacteroidota bacterium]|nr:hypothetical protein [Bacteroidota bacterium]